LRGQQAKLYHMGIRGRVSRSTLAYANEHRHLMPWGGLWVVTSNVPEKREAVVDAGYTFRRGDASDLADRLSCAANWLTGGSMNFGLRSGR
jgi:hypothetical protein